MKITQQLTRLRWEGERPIQDDEGDDGMVDGGTGTMIHEDDNNNKEIIHGDRGAGWEDFMSNYWRLLPPPLNAIGGGKGDSNNTRGNRCEAVLGGRPTDSVGALSPIRMGCMDIGMDLDNTGSILDVKIDHKLNY